MAGKAGQVSEKPAAMPERYAPDFLSRMDGRCKVARVLRDRLHALTQDLGGTDAMSYQQRSLCMRAIHLEARIEGWENQLAQGKPVDTGPYVQAVNALQGLYKGLGLSRQAKRVPALHEYLDGAQP